MKEIGRKSLEEVFGLPELKGAVTRVFEPGPLTPPIDPHYEFTPEQARILMLWESGITKKKGLLISGPTDCGKSSAPDQFAARTGRQVFRVGCHGKLEWQEMVGTLQFATDGSTFHVPGPVPCAMKAGGILIFEEINFLPPNTVGAANTLLDGGAVTVTETGEVVQADRDFRVCATANAIDQGDDAVLYRGTQTMNKALLRRFLTSRATYLEPQREAALLYRVAPKLPGTLIARLIEAVGDIRKQFLSGDLETVLGHSYMCDLARLMELRLPRLLDTKKHVVDEELVFLMRFNGLDAAPLDDANAILEVVKSKLTGQAFVAVSGPVPVTPQPPPTQTTRSQKVAPVDRNTTLRFLVNPARAGTGATPTNPARAGTGATPTNPARAGTGATPTIAFWAMTETPGATNAPAWNGTLFPTSSCRRAADKPLAQVQQTKVQKMSKRGYHVACAALTSSSEVDVVVKGVIAALSSVFGGADFMTTRQDVYELATAIMAEWTKSNLTQSSKSSGVPLAQIGTVR